ncbi:MAG TPA: hypothetical protein VF723_05295 [Pyrinomonadaceae bacterium]
MSCRFLELALFPLKGGDGREGVVWCRESAVDRSLTPFALPQ